MIKSISGLTLALGLATLAPVAASAHDHHWNGRSEYSAAHRDVAKVYEERRELAAARHKLHWALRNGDHYGARKAAHELHEERAELEAARRRLLNHRRDAFEDRYETYGAWRPARWHRWW